MSVSRNGDHTYFSGSPPFSATTYGTDGTKSHTVFNYSDVNNSQNSCIVYSLFCCGVFPAVTAVVGAAMLFFIGDVNPQMKNVELFMTIGGSAGCFLWFFACTTIVCIWKRSRS